jgi:hypothetical protein
VRVQRLRGDNDDGRTFRSLPTCQHPCQLIGGEKSIVEVDATIFLPFEVKSYGFAIVGEEEVLTAKTLMVAGIAKW